MRAEVRTRLLLASVSGVALGLLVSMALGLPVRPVPVPDETPVYLEVEVPDRLLECVRVGSGLACNWSDPLSAVSSLGPIERVSTTEEQDR